MSVFIYDSPSASSVADISSNRGVYRAILQPALSRLAHLHNCHFRHLKITQTNRQAQSHTQWRL